MAMQKRRNHILTGVSGEYFVAAELSRMGYVATLTLRNTRGIDILVSNQDATISVGIQVKTNRGRNKSWLLTEKAEADSAENLCYVFVNLNGNASPEYHIVPRTIVAEYVKSTHQAWLKAPGRGGKPHRDNAMRNFHDGENKYLNSWDLLGLGPPISSE